MLTTEKQLGSYQSSEMNPELYKAAQSGNWEAMKMFSMDFFKQQTANGNTILHILAQSSDSSAYAVTQIIAQKPNFISKKNFQGETPLVIASRRGHLNIVRTLIDCAKRNGNSWNCSSLRSLRKILRACDHLGNNALHEAIRYNRYDIVKLLIEEDPEYCNVPTFSGESPLYLASEKGSHEIVSLILSACKTASSLGPREKTALHAATLKNSPESMKLILEKRPNLARKGDAFGWASIHYAAKFNHLELVKLLLSSDKSMAYLGVKADDCKTALHIAVSHGHLDVVKEILIHCPDSWEIITQKRQNVIHLAVENEHKQVLEFFLQSSWAVELINKKDIKGNTPLHLYVTTSSLDGYNLVNHPCVDKTALNNKRLSPLDIITMQKALKDSERKTSILDQLVQAGATRSSRNIMMQLDTSKSSERETGESYMVVATLIVTVTFAAGFTLPGGYDSSKGNEGMAVLSRKAAFTTFIVADSLALVLSFIAVLEHLMFKAKLVPRIFTIGLKNLPRIHNAYYVAVALTLMVIAFLTGLYSVLPKRAIKIYLLLVGSLTTLPFIVCFFLSFLKLMHAGFSRLRELESKLEAELLEISESIV